MVLRNEKRPPTRLRVDLAPQDDEQAELDRLNVVADEIPPPIATGRPKAETSHDADAERSIIGALLIHRGAGVPEVAAALEPHDLYLLPHRLIYRAILNAHDRGGAVDLLIVKAALEGNGHLEEAGGFNALVDLAECCVSAAPAYVKLHVDTVREHAQRRRLAKATQSAIQDLQDGIDPADVLESFAEGVKGTSEKKPPSKPQPVTFAAGLDRWAQEGPLVHEPTGIVAFDELTGGGLCYGTRAVVIGAPDAGKTALLVQIADTYAQRGLAVGLLAIDEEPGDVIQRFLQRRGFTRRQCEVRGQADIASMRRHVENLGVRFYGDEFSIERAAEDLANVARERGTGAFLGIDSLQTAHSSLAIEATSRYEAVTCNMRAMRAAAAHHRMITMGTSEMSRSAYRSTVAAEQTNDMAAAKESGSIEFQSRVLVALRNVQGAEDRLELRFAKNKHGRVHRQGEAGIYLKIDRASQTITEDKDYVPAAAGDIAEAKVAQREQQTIEDAARLAVVLAKNPCIPARKCEELVTAATPGRMGRGRYSAARGRLGAGLVERPGHRTQVLLYLDGEAVPADVLAEVSLADRPGVAAARPPALPATDSDQPPRAAPSRPEVGQGGSGTTAERDAPRPPIGDGGGSRGAGLEIDTVGQPPNGGGSSGGSSNGRSNIEQGRPEENAGLRQFPLRVDPRDEVLDDAASGRTLP